MQPVQEPPISCVFLRILLVKSARRCTKARMASSRLAPYSKARRMRAKLDRLTLRPRLLVGSSGSIMFRNLSWKLRGVVLGAAPSGESPGGLYRCRMSAMKSSFRSGGPSQSGNGSAAQSRVSLIQPLNSFEVAWKMAFQEQPLQQASLILKSNTLECEKEICCK